MTQVNQVHTRAQITPSGTYAAHNAQVSENMTPALSGTAPSPTAPRDTRKLWIIFSMIAPLAGQSIVGMVMAAQGHWLILLMMLPTLGVMLVSLFAMRMRYSNTQYDDIQYGSIAHNNLQHNNTQYNNAQYNSIRYGTTQSQSPIYTANGMQSTHTQLLPPPAASTSVIHESTFSAASISDQIQACSTLPHFPRSFAKQYSWQSIAHAWSTRLYMHEQSSYTSLQSLSAPIGLELAPDTHIWQPYTIDLLRSGPHALIAGTTGSGKSYILRTWVVALATRYPPNDIQFIFLDFKGGSTFRDLHTLPHTVGFVSDLNISHALRALHAIERELHRREQLVAQYEASDIEHIPRPPAKLLVIIDEFAALRTQRPDAMDRLNTLATLGRSLGMHLIACTQHPSGQIGSDMKANIGLHICLRVRDETQSRELLGIADAATISPTAAGVGLSHDGEDIHVWRGSIIEHPERIVRSCIQAWQAFGQTHDVELLFSAPLPHILPPAVPLPQPHPAHYTTHNSTQHVVRDTSIHALSEPPQLQCTLGLADTGTHHIPAIIALDAGNIAVIGPPKRGTSTLLQSIYTQVVPLTAYYDIVCTTQQCAFTQSPTQSQPYAGALQPTNSDCAKQHTLRARSESRRATGVQRHELVRPPTASSITSILFVDDADQLLCPTNISEDAIRFRTALTDTHCTVIFAVHTARFVRHPEHCSIRVVFATGDISTDTLSGLDPHMLTQCPTEEFQIPGRAFLLQHGVCAKIQCHSI